VEQFQATAAVLAAAVEAEPPSDVRARVMAEVSRTRQTSPLVPRSDLAHHRPPASDELAVRRRQRRVERWLGAVAAVVLVAVSITVWLSRDDGSVTLDEQALERILEAPDAVTASLEPAGDGSGSLQVVWSRDRDGLAVMGDGLAAAGEGSEYELWLLLPDGAAAPAGLFQPDAAGQVRKVLTLEAEVASGFGVTIEPEGGSEQPTSSVLYQGEL
jgi:anti-sigma-K factor RskA